jgi:hypothetical protein
MAARGFVCVSIAVALCALAQASASGARKEADRDRPAAAHLQIADELEPCVDVLWERSTTFRRLYEGLASARNISITVSLRLQVAAKRRAETRVIRPPSGSVIAHVTILTLKDWPELIAHELEHVREQTFGVSLRLLAAGNYPGVWRIGTGIFETRAAIETGNHVAREVGGRGQYACTAFPAIGVMAKVP